MRLEFGAQGLRIPRNAAGADPGALGSAISRRGSGSHGIAFMPWVRKPNYGNSIRPSRPQT